MFKSLLDSLNAMKELEKGPYYLQFKLEYFDKIAPNDFEIDGFVPYTESISNKASFSIKHQPIMINESFFSTEYHSLDFQAQIDKFNLNLDKTKNFAPVNGLKRQRDDMITRSVNENYYDSDSDVYMDKRTLSDTDTDN